MGEIKFAAVVLTYNRISLLKENIAACEKQICKPTCMYIVDNNSNDDTESVIKEIIRTSLLNIKYIKLNKNYGSAGGFYYAIKMAFDDGYDWILTMDDDGRPGNENTFRFLVESAQKYHEKNPKVVVGPRVTYDGIHSSFSPQFPRDYIESLDPTKATDFCDFIWPYNGTIFSRELIEEIGFPEKDFFISGDEKDYNYRCIEAHATIKTVLNAVYFHPSPNNRYRKFLKWNLLLCDEWNERKQYYVFRNQLIVYLKHKKKYIAQRFYFNRLFAILLYERNKISGLKILHTARVDADRVINDWSLLPVILEKRGDIN